jgi:beta-glucosidase
VNPSGKLPVTFPVDEAQLPPFDNTSLEVTYDYFHGYRHVDREGLTPRFPFGYGLSYTTFSVANLRVANTQIGGEDAVRLTVDVTNTGEASGAEVVQAYVSYPGSAVVRAERDLKGFAKVSVAPGATESVEITIRVGDLAYYDTPNAQWVTEALDYEVHVGTSSRDLPLSETFSVD